MVLMSVLHSLSLMKDRAYGRDVSPSLAIQYEGSGYVSVMSFLHLLSSVKDRGLWL